MDDDPAYTEAEIRHAMTQVMHTLADETKTELVLRRLRENRGRSDEEAQASGEARS